MSTTPPTVPPAPQFPLGTGQPSETDLDKALAFIRIENERHRAYFKDLFDLSTKVFIALLAFAGVLVVFFGYNTISGAKAAAMSAATTIATDTAKGQAEKTTGEIQGRLTKEFETPRITALVDAAAERTTATTANKIIRGQVKEQTATAIANQQGYIEVELKTAAGNAVQAVRSDIQKTANEATARIVNEQVSPELRRLSQTTDAVTAMAGALGGDALAFDKAEAIAQDASYPPEIRRSAAGTVANVRLNAEKTIFAVHCDKPQLTIDQAVTALKTGDGPLIDTVFACLTNFGGDDSILSHNPSGLRPALDSIVGIMSSAASLERRKYGYFAFLKITEMYEFHGPDIEILNNQLNQRWWQKNRIRFLR